MVMQECTIKLQVFGKQPLPFQVVLDVLDSLALRMSCHQPILAFSIDDFSLVFGTFLPPLNSH